MKVKATTFAITTLPWYKKPFPHLVVLTGHKPETIFLALSLAGKDTFLGINLTSFKTTYPAKDIETYHVANFSEYTGLITLSND
jgi:hypothetical protein